MPDISYSDPRLAAVYDALNPAGADTAFYLDMAGSKPKVILDMGCGTGALAVELARRGHEVTGADPAAGMMAVARSRAGGDAVDWIESDAVSLDVPTRFDLVFMTGHVFQVFLTDEAIAVALRNLHRHLAPNGRLVFETRNPAFRDWEGWTPAETASAVEVAGIGRVEAHYEVTAVDGQIVRYETHFDFGGGDEVVAPSVLRFVERDQLAALLAEAGFARVEWYGDWDRSPVLRTSPELIIVAG
ncbi:methyltransferase domain-containing protein [Mesorhizobium sp. CC13]|uniref:class I SAM-dependent methyltransferase n=1 Tax=Mesorhizobium sp. CC13 TaxID=3029194 RepID=UPI0032676F99